MDDNVGCPFAQENEEAAKVEDVTFEGFPKIARLSRDCIVTEKIDGTNAQVLITGDGRVFAGSRNRLLLDSDNFGFAAWVRENEEALRQLGPGRHFGEWWGLGIQRGYGLKHKRFSLFNVSRWGDPGSRPACVGVVPTLYTGPFDTQALFNVMSELATEGSAAAPGFMNPEGIVVFHTASGSLFKKTFENDAAGKEALAA